MKRLLKAAGALVCALGLATLSHAQTGLTAVTANSIKMGGVAIPIYLAGWFLVPDEGCGQSMVEEMLGHGFTH